ncbi:MAG: hypothetical protein MI749_01330 [Desulfovibrionales bacterium]|nr:hypothetical protein [Desulfovibrionales bacterium]
MKKIVVMVWMAAVCAVMLAAGGCSQPVVQTEIAYAPVGFTPEFNWNNKIVWDEWVRRGKLDVGVYPTSAPTEAPTAVFFPFIPTVDIRDPLETGTFVAKGFWQEWLTDGPFAILEFQELGTTYTPDYAISIARSRGARFAVTGTLTDFFDGGSVTGARVGVALSIYDTANGALIWSMKQYAFMEKDRTRDYILFKAEMRVPTDPLWAVTTALAQSMKLPVNQWSKQWQAVDEQNSAAENAAF